MHDDRRLAGARRRRSPPRDAFVVERLREAGAVILGKTNLSEWANFRSTRSISGWSGRGGQARNPYALDRNPVRLELRLRRRGRRRTSARVGDRHRDRRLDRLPVDRQRPRRHQADGRAGEPRRHHPDRAQPGHGRADGAHGARRGAPARRDGRRRSARRRHRGEPRTRARATTRVSSIPSGLRGARIGVGAQALRLHIRRSTGVLEDALAELKRAGAVLVDPAEIPHARASTTTSELEVLLYEFKADLNAYLARARPGGAGAARWPT